MSRHDRIGEDYMARKLAHIEEISSITPIKGKDHLKQYV